LSEVLKRLPSTAEVIMKAIQQEDVAGQAMAELSEDPIESSISFTNEL